MEVTVVESSVTDIEATGHAETAIIPDPAFERVIDNVLAYQSLQMDGASGAIVGIEAERVDGTKVTIDAAKGVKEEDENFLNENAGKIPVVVALNKTDAVTKETVFRSLEKLNGFSGVRAVVPVSAKKGENLAPLMEEVEKLLPEGDALYPEDMYTDSTMRFMAAEIIREKALYLLDKEVPYGIGVYINKFAPREDKPIWDVDADIVCERQSHKAIVIGKGGGTLKKIATAAREDLEELTGAKVFLTLYVKVKSEWRESDYLMRELGYDVKDLKN